MVHSYNSDTVGLSLDNTTPAVAFISHWLQLKTVFYLQFITNFYDFVLFLVWRMITLRSWRRMVLDAAVSLFASQLVVSIHTTCISQLVALYMYTQYKYFM